MKTLLAAGVMSVVFATTCCADTFWVVSNRGTGKCEIVTTQPVVYNLPGYEGLGGKYNIYFSDGPYKSIDDAKIARSTISACPPQPASADDEK